MSETPPQELPLAIPLAEQVQDIYIPPNERTPEGYIDLEQDHLELQKALDLDWHHQPGLMGPVSEWPSKERQAAEEQIALINEGPDQPLNIDEIDRSYLLRLIKPNWVKQLDPETINKYPEEMRINLEALREVDTKLHVLSQDKTLLAAVETIKETRRAERNAVLKAAIDWIKTEDRITELAREITDIRLRYGRSDRPLTKAERAHITGLEARMEKLRADKGREIISDPFQREKFIKEVAEEIERRDRKKAQRQYHEGLVMTESVERVIEEALPSLVKGSPVLFVGETGGAKTALAEYLSRHYIGKEPELVSGYAEVNTYQLMGKAVLKGKEGATVSEFVAGPVVLAMQEGRPLILDEANAMPPEFLKRLNKIMQLRPGEEFSVQEESGLEVEVKQGFVIIATANEKSERHKGVHEFSAEFMNRFNADTYRIRYPDHDVVVGQLPVENMKIAYGAVCDASGELPTDISEDVLERFVRAAHLTQRLYSGHISEGLEQDVLDTIGTDRMADHNATGLKKTVLAPRTMAAMLTKVKNSGGSLSIERLLSTWVDGVEDLDDRRVLYTVLKSRRLLPSSEGPSSNSED